MALLDLARGAGDDGRGCRRSCRSRRCATGSITGRGARTAERFKGLAQPGQIVTVIGDAAKPGKSKEAIASAFEAALLGK